LAEALLAALDWRLAAAAFGTAVAGILRGYAGFGTAILLSPLYSLLWGPAAGVPVMLLLELFVSAQLVPRSWREADRPVILPIALAACAATPLGAVILLSADPETLRRVIGALVLTLGLLLLSPLRYHGPRPFALNVGVGLVSGVMKGSTGMSGPPVILYLLAGPDAARQHRANLIFFFGVIAVAAVAVPLAAGLITGSVLLKLALLLPVMLLFVRVGARLFRVVPERLYRPFALSSLVAVGLLALLA
jgi:uncharacterized membrane protein YfcA